jgi:hypothetical protein
MRLDLRNIKNEAGTALRYEPDIGVPALRRRIEVIKPLRATGRVTNSAGVLTLSAGQRSAALRVRSRCGAEFQSDREIRLDAVLSAEPPDRENPDVYPLTATGPTLTK